MKKDPSTCAAKKHLASPVIVIALMASAVLYFISQSDNGEANYNPEKSPNQNLMTAQVHNTQPENIGHQQSGFQNVHLTGSNSSSIAESKSGRSDDEKNKNEAIESPMIRDWIEQDKSLPEQAKSLREDIDLDGDSLISQEELGAPEERFKEMDLNQDSYISDDELAAHIKIPNAARLNSLVKMYNKVDSFFTDMDNDGDGYVTVEEFTDTESFFKRLDTDGDNIISPKEISVLLAQVSFKEEIAFLKQRIDQGYP